MSPGAKGKARDIIAAIRTLKAIEADDRSATEEEMHILSRFGGFGAVARVLFPDRVLLKREPNHCFGGYTDAGFQILGEALKELLTPEEYESARATTHNAYYTSTLVVSAMHRALKRLGVPERATVLEPGCGVGNFLGQAPSGMKCIGVEMDGISGRIARALHPNHEIRIEDFQKTVLPEGSLDAAIGNVPFANVSLDYKGNKLSLHDYFFAKTLDGLKPGGVAALVTTHFSLDKQNAASRELLASKADFLGAIRLPSDAFKREGTSVVTDIVFLRKRAPGEPERHADPEWLKVSPLTIEGVQVPINNYFHHHPEMVLGYWSRQDTLYHSDSSYSLKSNGNLTDQLENAIGRLPELETTVPARVATPPRFTQPESDEKPSEGSLFVGRDHMICQWQEGQAVKLTHGSNVLTDSGTMMGKRLASLIRIKNLTRTVLRSQNEQWPEFARDEARRLLNREYDHFVNHYGPINKTTISETADGTTIRRMPNLVKFKDDPDAMMVMALEDYDEATGTATKAAIMSKDVVGKAPDITRVKSAVEGLLVSLDKKGAVDLAFIASIYHRSEADIISELGDLIYLDPESKRWQTADEYLSGNVREKLKLAEAAGGGCLRNAEALRAVQPEDVLPGDIDANLGAPWIPESDVEAFAAHLFNVPQENLCVAHLKKDAVWAVEAAYAAESSVAATADYGTPRANGTWLFELALNMKAPVIYDTIQGANGEERVVNQEETLAAREKQNKIKEAFKSWIFSDAERSERLVRVYNDTYNNLRPRLFDGSHLAFPGMNKTITLDAHQKNAVWRGMSSGNTLLAHCVGAGKTFTMAATGMKLKQAGLVKKPCYVVPNHMLEQFTREFMQLYPNARLLAAGKDDLTKEKRKLLTAKIASGEWDGIIVTHSGFERIGMSKAYQERFLRDQIREYDELLIDAAAAKKDGAHRNIVKTIEKQKARRQERLKDLLAEEKKDDGLVFDELGIDHIFIDEAHYFKNLETPTKMDRVAGIQTGGSERAFDLYIKARYLDELHPGHGVTFATATPVSNTMVELYTMQRMLDPKGLKDRGIEHFDAWAATFGQVVDAMELSPDGSSLRPRSSFARFVNLPELQAMFGSFADVQTAEKLNLPRPRLAGGRPIVVSVPMSDEQQAMQTRLVERYDRLRSQKVDPREDNALAITTDGRKLALHPQLLSSTALTPAVSKVDLMADIIADTWKQTEATKATQMVFCDIGVNPTSWGFSVYDTIIQKLTARGIPLKEIAVIGDADTDAKKQALFERVRSGGVRVLIGSTQKMGVGTNVQKRLIAKHDLDAPWKPAEVEQRDGRILRQGNQNEEVSIYRYVTEGSFDAYMWQALERKAKFINQVMTGESTARSAEDIGGQELSYAEVKAIASGNPAVLTLAQTDAELQRLSILKKNHDDEQFLARRKRRELPVAIESLGNLIAGLSADLATMKAHADAPIRIGERAPPHDQLVPLLAGKLDALPQILHRTQKVPLGIYHGLNFGIILHEHFSPEVYLEGGKIRTATLSEHRGARAVLNALERLANGYPTAVNKHKQDLAIAENQLKDYETRVGAPFPHEAYRTELEKLRDQLRLSLSTTTPAEGRPTSGEIVERINALRAGNNIEASAVRTTHRRQVAETPVTTLIRQRNEPHEAHEAPCIALSTTEEPDHGPPVLTISTKEITNMSLKTTTTIESPETSEAADAHQIETAEPANVATLPEGSTKAKQHAADPRPWHTISLCDYNGGPQMELRRSFKYKQLQIAFDGEQPDEKYLARLAEAGWKDRTETEGVWTKQLPPGEWKPVYDGERLFLDIANEIRREKGLSKVSAGFQVAGA